MTARVFSQLQQVRMGGAMNMCDWQGVQRIAYDSGFYDLVIYIQDDPKRYSKFILSGELPEGEENPAHLSDGHNGVTREGGEAQ